MSQVNEERCQTCQTAGKGCYWDGISRAGKRFQHRVVVSKKARLEDDDDDDDDDAVSLEEVVVKSKLLFPNIRIFPIKKNSVCQF
jgi:positive regulator of sigma E activity